MIEKIVKITFVVIAIVVLAGAAQAAAVGESITMMGDFEPPTYTDANDGVVLWPNENGWVTYNNQDYIYDAGWGGADAVLSDTQSVYARFGRKKDFAETGLLLQDGSTLRAFVGSVYGDDILGTGNDMRVALAKDNTFWGTIFQSGFTGFIVRLNTTAEGSYFLGDQRIQYSTDNGATWNATTLPGWGYAFRTPVLLELEMNFTDDEVTIWLTPNDANGDPQSRVGQTVSYDLGSPAAMSASGGIQFGSAGYHIIFDDVLVATPTYAVEYGDFTMGDFEPPTYTDVNGVYIVFPDGEDGWKNYSGHNYLYDAGWGGADAVLSDTQSVYARFGLKKNFSDGFRAGLQDGSTVQALVASVYGDDILGTGNDMRVALAKDNTFWGTIFQSGFTGFIVRLNTTAEGSYSLGDQRIEYSTDNGATWTVTTLPGWGLGVRTPVLLELEMNFTDDEVTIWLTPNDANGDPLSRVGQTVSCDLGSPAVMSAIGGVQFGSATYNIIVDDVQVVGGTVVPPLPGPGTGVLTLDGITDDFEDLAWSFDDVNNISSNGKWSTSFPGAPELLAVFAPPAGGVSGQIGALRFQTYDTDPNLDPNWYNGGGDPEREFLAVARSVYTDSFGRYPTVEDLPSYVSHIYLPAYADKGKDEVTLTLGVYAYDSPPTYDLGYTQVAVGYKDNQCTFSVSNGYESQPIVVFGDETYAGGWVTVGISFDDAGTAYFFFKEGVAALTEADRVFDMTNFNINYDWKMYRVEYHWLNVGYDPDNPSISPDFRIEDVSVYYHPTCADAVARGLTPVTDLNDDCKVDMDDLAIFLVDWLDCHPQATECQ